jgi:hypothetical protein
MLAIDFSGEFYPQEVRNTKKLNFFLQNRIFPPSMSPPPFKLKPKPMSKPRAKLKPKSKPRPKPKSKLKEGVTFITYSRKIEKFFRFSSKNRLFRVIHASKVQSIARIKLGLEKSFLEKIFSRFFENTP